MGLAEDLLNQAHFLSHHERGRPKQATLRRSISSAYYAVFHLLVANAAMSLVPNKPSGLIAKVSRAFQHGEMKQVCLSFHNGDSPESVRTLLPPKVSKDLQFVAATFVALQQLRHKADYDTGLLFTRAQASEAVNRANELFMAWNRIVKTDEARVFLAALAFGARWSK
jgi:uncharacterized protein (UPF0332 family)